MMLATENVKKTAETLHSSTHCHLNWVEIDRQRLTHNLQLFRRLVGKERKLLVVVKSNAYGHGMCEVSEISMEGGADWLGVYSLEEGLALRSHGLKCPVLVMGYIPRCKPEIRHRERPHAGRLLARCAQGAQRDDRSVRAQRQRASQTGDGTEPPRPS